MWVVVQELDPARARQAGAAASASCQGQVYVFTPDPAGSGRGRLALQLEPLERLDPAEPAALRLRGRHAIVRNGGAFQRADATTGRLVECSIGAARPDVRGNFVFRPRSGGGRLDKLALPDDAFVVRYSEASHFGEVNSYYHVDRLAAYLDALLAELGRRSLPKVTIVVHAHHAATEQAGVRDGVRGRRQWLPFQGGHYRLPGGCHQLAEPGPLSVDGEIHLGPGWRLLEHGALVELWGHRYRACASHNPGILYHEYGHHLTRHTADFQNNRARPPERQRNRKAAIDEGTCDYFAAVGLGTPHVWICHQRHDDVSVHPRSLVSRRTLSDFDPSPRADAHANGTIWGAALYAVRAELEADATGGGRLMDLLVVDALCRIGDGDVACHGPAGSLTRRTKTDFSSGLRALIRADQQLFAGRHTSALERHFSLRGIEPGAPAAAWRSA